MTDLSWETAGDGGRTFLWAHGLTSSRQGDDDSPLAGLRPAVVDAGWRCVRYDARGHGSSPAPHDEERYVWSRLADDMLAVADAAGAERFCAGGASMGAATSLYCALAAPSRVEALVLVIPPTAWTTRADQGDMYRKMAAIAETKGLAHLVDLARREPPTTFFGAEGKERGLRNMEAMDGDAYPWVMRGAGRSDLPDPDVVRTITAPTLLLAWTDDPGHPVSTAERLHELLPVSTLVVARSPDDVATWPSAVTDFLSEH